MQLILKDNLGWSDDPTNWEVLCKGNPTADQLAKIKIKVNKDTKLKIVYSNGSIVELQCWDEFRALVGTATNQNAPLTVERPNGDCEKFSPSSLFNRIENSPNNIAGIFRFIG